MFSIIGWISGYYELESYGENGALISFTVSFYWGSELMYEVFDMEFDNIGNCPHIGEKVELSITPDLANDRLIINFERWLWP